jgi:hypothetical protein
MKKTEQEEKIQTDDAEYNDEDYEKDNQILLFLSKTQD